MIKKAGMAINLGIIALALSAVSACGIFGSDDEEEIKSIATSLGVNGYLWQASLETLSFMPIESADPNAAVILTDWHSLEESPTERVRVAVRFLTVELRSDGIRVSVVRQEKRGEDWVTVPTQATTVLKVEEAILTRARQLRVSRFS